MNNYNIIRKDRNSHGGGVAIIINDQLEYEQLDLFEEFNLELIAIKVTLNNYKFNFVTFYLPPKAQLPAVTFLLKLSMLENLIMCGDLNCKSKQWYSKKTNTNGKLLEQIIAQFNLSIVKNKKPTHYWQKTNKLDILDIIITSPDINNKIINLKIPQDELQSDRFPLIFEIDKLKISPARNKIITIIDKEKQKRIIEEKIHQYYQVSIENHNLILLINLFENIVEQATITKEKKVDNINLPSYILTLIHTKNSSKK